MDDGFDFVVMNCMPDEGFFADVAFHQRPPFHRPSISRSQIVEHNWLEPMTSKGFRNMAADVTSSSGYQNTSGQNHPGTIGLKKLV